MKYLGRIALGGIRQGCLHRLNHLKATGGWLDAYPDISRADLRSNRDKALRALARNLADSFQSLFLSDQRKITDEALAECMSGAYGLAGWITGHTRFPLGGFADFGYVMRFLHLVSPEIG